MLSMQGMALSYSWRGAGNRNAATPALLTIFALSRYNV